MQGPAKEFLSMGHLHNLPEIHDSDPVADMFDDPKIMRDKEIGESELIPQIHQEIEDLGLNGNIQGRDRFIRYNQFRMEGDGPGNADPLALSAAELVRITKGILTVKPDLFKNLQDPLFHLLSRCDPMDLEDPLPRSLPPSSSG